MIAAELSGDTMRKLKRLSPLLHAEVAGYIEGVSEVTGKLLTIACDERARRICDVQWAQLPPEVRDMYRAMAGEQIFEELQRDSDDDTQG